MELYDPYANLKLPGDVSDWAQSRAIDNLVPPESAGLEMVRQGQESARAPILDRWDVVTHQYRRDAAAKIGFFGKLFSGSGKVVTAGVTQEAKQYKVEETEDDRQVELGVAVRLAVATSSFAIDVELTVPNLAAAAQLGMADTRIGIYILGFRGPIGDIMPSPTDLNVENFAGFMAAFSAIQKRVFDIEHAAFLSPTLLGYREKGEESA